MGEFEDVDVPAVGFSDVRVGFLDKRFPMNLNAHLSVPAAKPRIMNLVVQVQAPLRSLTMNRSCKRCPSRFQLNLF